MNVILSYSRSSIKNYFFPKNIRKFYLFFRQDDHMSQLRKQEMTSSRLSRLYDERRAHKRRICNVIHNSTWLAGSCTYLVCYTFQMIAHSVDPYLVNSISGTLASLIFWRIIAPFTHLFNEQKIKVIVLENGWLCAIKHAWKFNVVIEESQSAHADRQSRLNVTGNPITQFKESDSTRKVASVADRVEVFSIELKNRMEERQKTRFIAEVTVPSHLSNDNNVLPNAVPSW